MQAIEVFQERARVFASRGEPQQALGAWGSAKDSYALLVQNACHTEEIDDACLAQVAGLSGHPISKWAQVYEEMATLQEQLGDAPGAEESRRTQQYLLTFAKHTSQTSSPRENPPRSSGNKGMEPG